MSTTQITVRYATMEHQNNVISIESREGFLDALAELLREGAKLLIADAVVAKLEELLSKYPSQRTADGRVTVVRRGRQPQRQ